MRKDGLRATVEIFSRNSKSFSASILALGHVLGFDSIDFLLATGYRSMPFGRCGYELYSLKNEVFARIDISNITKGTPFTIKVDENNQIAQTAANHTILRWYRFQTGICMVISSMEMNFARISLSK